MTDQKPDRQDEAGLLLALANEITAEADNISPTRRTHPAGLMIKWASRLRRIARISPTRDGAEGAGGDAALARENHWRNLEGRDPVPPKPAPER